MEMLKTVTEPITEVVMTSQVRGILDEYEGVDSEVLYTEGEIHSNMKPVSQQMRCSPGEDESLNNIIRPVGLSPLPYCICTNTICFSSNDWCTT